MIRSFNLNLVLRDQFSNVKLCETEGVYISIYSWYALIAIGKCKSQLKIAPAGSTCINIVNFFKAICLELVVLQIKIQKLDLKIMYSFYLVF